MKMLLTVAFMSAPAMLCCVTSLHAFVNPCIDLDEEAQEACVAQYTKDRGSSATEAVASEDRSDSTDLVQAVLDDYRSLKTWKERLDLIRTLKTDAQNALDSGEWDGAPNWRYPLKPGVTIMDGDLSRDAMDAATYAGLAALDVVLCNRNGDYTYTEDVYISSGSCTWQGGTVDITGRLIINTGATLNVVTNSSYTEIVIVRGTAASSYAVSVYGTLYLRGLNSGKNVHLYVGEGKKIALHNHGYLNADTSTNSRIYFWAEDLTTWNGIEAQDRGAQVRLYGGTSSTDRIYVYGLGSGSTGIQHKGGTSTYNGKLVVRGTKFYTTGTDQNGIYINYSDESMLQYYNNPITIEYTLFDGFEEAITFSYIYTNQAINIKYNTIKNFSGGILMYEARSASSISILSNDIGYFGDINTPLPNAGIAIAIYGTNSYLNVSGNTISHGATGIIAGDIMPVEDDEVNCSSYFNNNSISVVYTHISLYQFVSLENRCTNFDDFQINGNTLSKWGTTYYQSDYYNYGMDIFRNGSADAEYPEHIISYNTIEGMLYGIHIAGTYDFKIHSNILSFGQAPQARNPRLLYVHGQSTENTEIYNNYFLTNSGESNKKHIYNTGTGTTCHDNTFYLTNGGTLELYNVNCTNSSFVD